MATIKRPEWQDELVRVAILFRLAECGEKIDIVRMPHDDITVIEPDLSDLAAQGLIEARGQQWAISKAGREWLGKAIEMLDHVLHFEIFGGVRLSLDMPADMMQEDEPAQVQLHLFDPRFLKPGEQAADALDLRLAMLSFLSEQMASELQGRTIDPHRIVFLQMLGTGAFNSPTFWFDLKLGLPFNKVEEVVNTAYGWRDASPDSEEHASAVMRELYTAGMAEQRKRDGCVCSGCGIPLAMFEAVERTYGRELRQCPNPDCGASFDPPAHELECPNCHAGLTATQRSCRGCGAIVDRSLAPGEIVQETTEHVVETSSYGVVPYGYYDPWDPFVDVLAFGCLVAIL